MVLMHMKRSHDLAANPPTQEVITTKESLLYKSCEMEEPDIHPSDFKGKVSKAWCSDKVEQIDLIFKIGTLLERYVLSVELDAIVSMAFGVKYRIAFMRGLGLLVNAEISGAPQPDGEDMHDCFFPDGTRRYFKQIRLLNLNPKTRLRTVTEHMLEGKDACVAQRVRDDWNGY